MSGPKLRVLRAENAQAEAEGLFVGRPRTVDECPPGPCPWAACRYHLFLDVGPTGAIKLNFPDKAPTDLRHPCALRVADEFGGLTLDEVSERMNLTAMRALYLLRVALRKATAAKAELETP